RDFSRVAGQAGERCPSLSAIDPNYGDNSEDVPVMIRGSDFSDTPTVYVGAEELQDVAVITPNLLKATVPQGIEAGTYDLVLTNGYGCSAILEDAYTAIDPGEIKVLSIEPDSAENDQDTQAVITGVNFIEGATAYIGNLKLDDAVVESSTKISVVIPFGLDAGKYDISVYNSESSYDTLVDGFTVIESGALYVKAIDPNTGSNDQDVDVTITGRNFEDTPAVYLGAVELQSVQFFSDQVIAAVVPAGLAPATYDLTVINPDEESFTLEEAYTVTEPEER
ncbi:MAG TPA: hypothetical protein ENF73_05825, partial [Proteobacteria bacterium]|nr:hypothetical protein [Pseudomonadota bacterium]